MNLYYINTNTTNKDDLKTMRDLALQLLGEVTNTKVREKIQEDLWDLNDIINRDEPPVILDDNETETEQTQQ